MNKILITAIAVVALQGCTNHMSRDFGQSHANNLAAQAVNPKAAEEGSTADGMDGIKAGIAIEEYKTAENKNEAERLVRDVGD